VVAREDDVEEPEDGDRDADGRPVHRCDERLLDANERRDKSLEDGRELRCGLRCHCAEVAEVVARREPRARSGYNNSPNRVITVRGDNFLRHFAEHVEIERVELLWSGGTTAQPDGRRRTCQQNSRATRHWLPTDSV
jgi:hypothetical protein